MGFLESGSDDFCGKELQKYFFVVAAGAVLILIGSYWYVNYYKQGVDVDIKNAHIDYPTGKSPAGKSAVVNPVIRQQPGAGRTQQLATPFAPVQAPVGNNARNPVMSMQPVAGGFASVAAQLRNSVVNVNVAHAATPGAAPVVQNALPAQNGARFANPSTGRTVETIGSGIIIREDGYILTNYHVVQSGAVAYVTVFDDVGSERYRAEVVKLDEVLDLALLKIRPKSRLIAARLGDSNRMRVADQVLAIGSPFGLDQTVSQGVISGLRKSLLIEGIEHTDLIQTDAAINQGNSGGPLVDRGGYVVGINTAIYSPTGAFAGIGFAIPSNQAVRFVQDEIDLRIATWGQPGIAGGARGMQVAAQGQPPMAPPIPQGIGSPHTDGREQMDCTSCHQILTATAQGGRVVAGMVYAQPGAIGGNGGPGYNPAIPTQAGPPIMVGMQAPHRDGRENMACSQCHQMINQNGPANVVAMQYAQPPVGLGINVAVPNSIGTVAGPRVLGATILPIDPTLAASLAQPEGKGVFVTEVMPGSPMDKAGVQAGDVLLKLDGRRLRSPRQLIRRMGEIINGDDARFSVLRDGRRSQVTVRVLAMSMPGAAPSKQAPPPPPPPTEFAWRGMEIKPLPAATTPRGGLVEEVAGASPAANAGIQNNDIILMIDSFTVESAKKLDAAIRTVGKNQPVWLKVNRGGRDLYLKLG